MNFSTYLGVGFMIALPESKNKTKNRKVDLKYLAIINGMKTL